MPFEATLQDLLAPPEEGQGYEIIDGELVQKEASGRRSRVQAGTIGSLYHPFGCCDGKPTDQPGGWWFATRALIDFGALWHLRPDMAGWRRNRFAAPPSGPLTIEIPDWICEVLSPSIRIYDLVRRKEAYHQRQVGHYWLLHPMDGFLSVLRWSPDGYVEILDAWRGERVRAEPFVAAELEVTRLFGDDELA